ncbi:hypothetical protein JXA80_00815 [bacterium]|nr:hypothetical protein [candidate division CSSED10-310 bacterium]
METRRETIYLVCPKRRNNPRINIEICKVSCRYASRCPAYLTYRQPGLFDGLDCNSRRTVSDSGGKA